MELQKETNLTNCIWNMGILPRNATINLKRIMNFCKTERKAIEKSLKVNFVNWAAYEQPNAS